MTNKKKAQTKKKQAQAAQQAHHPQPNGVEYDHISLLMTTTDLPPQQKFGFFTNLLTSRS